ncbi:motility associated factor glycosyltransferase family protein [Desulfotomaculum copahuensis]|uniref:6-hydroxymethylpterin diphosphokinase MptE-like domain-containing protein n=1 Tax=Desulfotomaculum copahuensis TaxID=1838280 RepID=A0A1B7LCA3_9FIRM|nr:6-hydroxymethylpterin diphosphokinase MptE-like protein [Desulfotomaculum copahuensis]OAT80377.1 hypothetical protein A6M21_13495 [Desulfotomaculum copahuensis]
MLLETNLNALKKTDSYLASIIEQARADQSCRLLKAANGLPTAVAFDGGKPAFLHSRYDPVREAMSWAEVQKIASVQALALLGFGLGYHVRALINRLQPDQQLRVYQFGLGSFKRALESMNLVDLLLDHRLSLIVEDDQAVLAGDLAGLLKSGAQLLIHEPSLRAFPKGPLWETINEWRIKKASVIRFGRLLEDNYNANLPVLSSIPLINDYFGRLAGQPLLLAAGGPSLDEIIPYLHCKKELFVLAVGTALAPLMKAGIRPDMVIVTDPLPVIARQLTSIDAGTPLIILPTVSPAVISGRFSQLILALQEGFGPAEEMAEQRGAELIATGGSVSTTALDIAIRMGAKPIMLAGLDLAYPSGKMHATGTMHGDNVLWVQDEMVVTGVDGSPVVTTPVLNIYRRWIERRIAQAEDLEVVNLSPSGACIANTKALAPAFLLNYFVGGKQCNHVQI